MSSLPPLPQKVTPATVPVSTPRHRLHALFRPESIAIFGASEQPGSTGWHIYESLLQSNFTGRVHAIHPGLKTIFGHPCLPDLDALDKPPDLAVLALPCEQIEALVPKLAAAGVHHAIWLLNFQGETPAATARRVAGQARALGITLLGADSLGLAHSAVRMNLLASNAQVMAGGVAVLSQSSAICSALLDYAQGNGIGLSTAVDTGTESGVDLADLLDYLAFDGHTRSIALFIGDLQSPRRFLSALRAAARLKPVVVLCSGQSRCRQATTDTPRTRLTHAENLVSHHKTLQSALARCGAVIVQSFGELFATLEWLGDNRGVQGNRLAIVSNGGGLNQLAEDACQRYRVQIVRPADETLATLPRPPSSSDSLSPGSPCINLGMSCTPAQAADTLRQVAADRQADAVLGIFQPTLTCDASSLAREILAGPAPNPALLALVGDADARRGAEQLTKNFSVFRTPEDAVQAFAVLAEYQRGQQRLLEAPGPSWHATHFDEARIGELLARAIHSGESMLNQLTSNDILAACGIPVPRTHIAANIDEAVALARDIGYPVVLKVQSREIVHKSDIGGVRLDIRNEDELRSAARAIEDRLATLSPPPRLEGLLLQPMMPRRHSREVLVGASHDPAFGPVLHFGSGGITVELIDDTAVELPPLSPTLARELIDRTRVSRLLHSHHGEPPADIDALVDVLLAISALLTRFPAVQALDINPLLVGPQGVIALDARIRLDLQAHPLDSRYSHLAIHPYPVEAERRFTPRSEAETPAPELLMRPIRPDDAPRLAAFVADLSDESRLWRFLHPIRVMSPQMVSRFTQVDYDRDMAFVVVEEQLGPEAPILGVARYFREPSESRCEFAIVVLDSWQGHGLAKVMMQHLIDTARANGLDTMIGLVHGNNTRMLNFMRRLGFRISKDPDEPELRQVTLHMPQADSAASAPEHQ